MSAAVKAPHGEKTIALTVRFWTSEIVAKGKVSPGECWDSGMVRFKMSKTHRIGDNDWEPFNDLTGLTAAVKKAARRAGVKLLPSK